MKNARSVVLAVLAGGSVAQAQCTPEWERAIGNPGVSGGYAAPVALWDHGASRAIYVGGSFSSIGVVGTTLLGKYDLTTNTWSRVGNGLSTGFTNGFLTAIRPYRRASTETLIVAGFFDSAGGVANSASIAQWNGTSWSNLGAGWNGTNRGSVWSLVEWGGKLYVGGGFSTIGGVGANGIASWDGTTWSALGSGITGSFSPVVFALAVFDDGRGEKLYAAGRFDAVNGLAGTRSIARWTGSAWETVGGGLFPTSTLFGPEAMIVHENSLHVAGYAMTANGMSTTNVAKWNGSAWSALGTQIGTGRLTSIAVFDDGTGETLYVGGTAMPQIGQIARWRNNTWETLGGGATGPGISPSNFPSVFGLAAVDDKLYVAGNFTQLNNDPVFGIAAWSSCLAQCYPDCDTSTGQGVLDIFDFLCFQNRYATTVPYACDCDTSTGAGVCDIFDFLCFQNAFAVGCP